MKIVVTGVKGQLGHDLVEELRRRNYNEVLGIDINNLDITDNSSVQKYMNMHKPVIIIHCAAFTAVDDAEEKKDLCMNINADGTKYLVDAARKHNAKFLYISTDYVFDGNKLSCYTIHDIPNPQSVYGKSKLEGEHETLKYDKHFIVRIAWVFGKNGNNFVKTMLRLGKEKESIDVVGDQYGSPTYTYDLSRFLVDLIETEKYGIYHATNEGYCSWYDFASEIFKLAGYNLEVNSIDSSHYPTKARRPKNSRMDKSILDVKGFKRLPEWQDALKRYLEEIGEI